MGSLVGVILAASLTKEQLYAWGWRVPFVIGIVIAPVALYIRRQLRRRSRRARPIGPAPACCRSCSGTTGVGAVRRAHHLRRHHLDLHLQLHEHYAITTLHLSATVGTTLTLPERWRRSRTGDVARGWTALGASGCCWWCADLRGVDLSRLPHPGPRHRVAGRDHQREHDRQLLFQSASARCTRS
jgi:MFS family permease